MKSVADIAAAVREGRVTAADVAHDTGVRLAAADAAGLNATLHWSPQLLEQEATRVAAGTSDGLLAGVPVAIKDNIVTEEQPTTCGSRILEGYRSPYNATVVERLRSAGAMIAGKTNLDEFAMGSSTEHSAYGRVRHPLDAERVPGGSSGGSAALVAAGVVPAALGSETGGSVRQPASFCGIVGLKPGYGRVSRSGLVAFGSSLDCVSVFGATVADAASLLHVISGPDPYDATTVDAPPVAIPEHRDHLEGVVIGLPRECFPDDLDAGVRAACDRTVARLRSLGAEVRDVSLPHSRYAVATYYVINPAEASANLARYDGVRYGQRRGDGVDLPTLYRATRGEGFGAEVQRRIITGTYVLSAGYYDAYYTRAQQARNRIAGDFDRLFREEGVSYLFTPTTPTVAFKAGEKTEDPVAMYLADIFVCAVSLAGLPALSIPIGRSEGLPVGGHFIGPALDETGLLQAAAVVEQAVDGDAEVRP
jgi:aspartyl-tRNA(Asn)/glutamyl-tRNA(Gln) amidotransferase subunit A